MMMVHFGTIHDASLIRSTLTGRRLASSLGMGCSRPRNRRDHCSSSPSSASQGNVVWDFAERGRVSLGERGGVGGFSARKV